MTMNRRTFLYGSVAATAVLSSAGPVLAQGGDLKSRLDAALRAHVDAGEIPMAVGGITDASGTTYLAAFGESTLGSGETVTEDSVFNMASMTKAITATAAMQLVEQGKLDLDSPISTWIPDAANLEVLDGFDGDGKPVLRPAAREITLRDLMTHSAGTTYTLWDAELQQYSDAVGGMPSLDYDEPSTWMQPLKFDPGTRWEYGIAIDWIGRLVQEVSGQSLGTYMKANIFDPLGMESTGYKLTDSMAERRVENHLRQEDGSLEVAEWNGQTDPVREYGGGGLYGTTPDYLKFIRMILNNGSGNGNQILKPETVADMSTNQMGDVRVEMLHTTNSDRSLDAEFFPGLEKSWGLSFMINEEDAPTGRPAGSLAWAGLYNTFFWIDPSNGVGGVFMSQLLPFVDEKVLQAFYDFESAYYDTEAS
ncbi:MAG: serine hydrolase domain-containing protein [Sulfitobacter sp.]